jgi:ABC-2 type transport system ATP-binding protein
MTTATPSTVIRAARVSRAFGHVDAVMNLDLDIRTGEIFGLVGPDGAGKTTVMRMLAGVLLPDSGSIELAGVDVVAEPERAKSLLSYMPQRFGLYEDLSVDENIFFYGELFAVPREARRRRGAELLEAAGMTPFRRRLAGALSGGMKQKLGLVCALIHTPSVLLLDEPTTGVDPVSRRDFWGILYKLREEGVTIVLSTAYMDEAERCSRLALLHGGRIRQCDTPSRLKRNMTGVLLAIIGRDPRAMHTLVESMPGVFGALLMGDRVHVRVDDAALRSDQIREMLRAHDMEPLRIERIEPSIEDVFVALVGSQS